MATGVCKVSVEGGSEETFEFICTSCKETKLVEAEKYCQDCDEHYCLICVDFHKRFPALRNHVILDRGDFGHWGKQIRTSTIHTETCQRHKGKLVELFCGQHRELCCHICVSLDHRICEDMQYIAEVSTGINESEDLKVVKKHLEELKTELEEKRILKPHKPLEISRCQILEQITDFRKHVDEIFDALQKKLTYEMDELANDISISHQEHQKACDDILIQIQQLQHQLESSKPQDEPQVFITMKKSQFQIPKVKKAMEELPSQCADEKMIFEVDPKLINFVANIDCLGTVSLTGSALRSMNTFLTYTDGSIIPDTSTHKNGLTPQQTLQAIPSNLCVLEKHSTQTTQDTPIKVSRYEKTNIKLQSDNKRCNIQGMCQMPDGTILLTDHQNCNIKRLDPSNYRTTDHIDLPAAPVQICSINDREVVVASGGHYLIFVYVRKQSFLINKSIKMSHTCLGVLFNNGRIFVTDNNNKAYIYTMEGKHIRTIKVDSGMKNMFSGIRQLASSRDGTTIFVADQNYGLIVLDTEGKLVSSNRGKNLVGAESVHVDVYGRVLLCNFDSKTIIQMKSNGSQAVRNVVTLKFRENPISVCIDHHRNKMLVTIENDNYIRVYDIFNN